MASWKNHDNRERYAPKNVAFLAFGKYTAKKGEYGEEGKEGFQMTLSVVDNWIIQQGIKTATSEWAIFLWAIFLGSHSYKGIGSHTDVQQRVPTAFPALVSSYQDTLMPHLPFRCLCTRRQHSTRSLLLATAMLPLAVLLVCMPTLARVIDPALQHRFDNVRWAMDNLSGAVAPDSSCQPACRSILLRWLKHTAGVTGRYLH